MASLRDGASVNFQLTPPPSLRFYRQRLGFRKLPYAPALQLISLDTHYVYVYRLRTVSHKDLEDLKSIYRFHKSLSQPCLNCRLST